MRIIQVNQERLCENRLSDEYQMKSVFRLLKDVVCQNNVFKVTF